MKMPHIGESIAFAALVAGATVLEIHDKPAYGLWVLIVLWAVLTSFNKTSDDS